MGKSQKLINKYIKTIPESIIKYFYDSDPTDTKKYFEYMLKMWDKKLQGENIGVELYSTLSMSVGLFNKLLPYIKNKDIYSKEYSTYSGLRIIINDAINIKNKKEKERKIIKIYEDDNFFMIHPLSVEASAKYGADTTWCTTMKKEESTFERHKKGWLVYVISKKHRKNKNFNKVALYSNIKNYEGINSSYDIYNSKNEKINGFDLYLKDWSNEEIIIIDSEYRKFIHSNQDYYLDHQINLMESIITIRDYWKPHNPCGEILLRPHNDSNNINKKGYYYWIK